MRLLRRKREWQAMDKSKSSVGKSATTRTMTAASSQTWSTRPMPSMLTSRPQATHHPPCRSLPALRVSSPESKEPRLALAVAVTSGISAQSVTGSTQKSDHPWSTNQSPTSWHSDDCPICDHSTPPTVTDTWAARTRSTDIPSRTRTLLSIAESRSSSAFGLPVEKLNAVGAAIVAATGAVVVLPPSGHAAVIDTLADGTTAHVAMPLALGSMVHPSLRMVQAAVSDPIDGAQDGTVTEAVAKEKNRY